MHAMYEATGVNLTSNHILNRDIFSNIVQASKKENLPQPLGPAKITKRALSGRLIT